MSLPISISPCPIIEAVLDIWFETDAPEEAIYGLTYRRLTKDFPTSSVLPPAAIPAAARNMNPALLHLPYFRFERKDLAVLVGPKNVAIGMLGGYPKWAAWSASLRHALSVIEETGLNIRPYRFGLRYVNYFSGDIFPKLKLAFALEEKLLSGSGTFFKIVLPAPKCQLLLQVGKDMAFPNLGLPPGSVIDIDAFLDSPTVAGGLAKSAGRFLDVAHDAEKKLFFSLLKDEFLNTLNPVRPP